jgi:chromosome segregation ATPase
VADRMAQQETSHALVRAAVEQVQAQSQQFAAYYANFTTQVLPAVYTEVGGLQQRSQALEDTSKSLELRTQALQQAVAAQAGTVTAAQERLQTQLSELAAGTRTEAQQQQAVTSELQRSYADVAVLSNVTAARVTVVDTTLQGVVGDVRQLTAQQLEAADTTRRLSGVAEQVNEVAQVVRTAEASAAATARNLQQQLDALAARLHSAEDSVQRQQKDIVYLQEENRRLLHETASAAALEEVRRLLYEVQGGMLSHSSKVLDLLLQPRSAVLVHPPPTTAAAATATAVAGDLQPKGDLGMQSDSDAMTGNSSSSGSSSGSGSGSGSTDTGSASSGSVKLVVGAPA